MPGDSRKVARKRQKRAQNRQVAHRARSGSPYRLIGERGTTQACFINGNWRDEGLATMHVVKRGPDGRSVVASFLVDIWCMGLKDAWGVVGMSEREFLERLESNPYCDLEIQRVDIDLVKRLVAGGIRFANRNGFRLPHRYQRWTAILGDMGNSAEAGLTDFGLDGRLLFTGPLDDLKKRLIGCKVEEFLSRDDVDADLVDDVESALLPDERAEFDAGIAQMTANLVNAVKEWCFSQEIAPHPRLGDAVDILIESQFAIRADPADAEASPDLEYEDEAIEPIQPEELENAVKSLLELLGPEDRISVQAALDQIGAFMKGAELKEIKSRVVAGPEEDVLF